LMQRGDPAPIGQPPRVPLTRREDHDDKHGKRGLSRRAHAAPPPTTDPLITRSDDNVNYLSRRNGGGTAGAASS
jgi:hypothetical protein